MARQPRRHRVPDQPPLPFGAPAAPAPVAPKPAAVPAPQPSESLASLVESLCTAWNAKDWPQIHALMDALKDHPDLKGVSYVPRLDRELPYFAIATWYWQEQAEYWRAEAASSARAIDTVVDRLDDLQLYESGADEHQAYVEWLREHGHPETLPWDTDPAWFAHPDVIGFVLDTLESTSYYMAQVQRTIAAMKGED